MSEAQSEIRSLAEDLESTSMDENRPKHNWGGWGTFLVLNSNSDKPKLWENKALNWMSCRCQLHCHLSSKFWCLQFVRQCNNVRWFVAIIGNYAADIRTLLQGCSDCLNVICLVIWIWWSLSFILVILGSWITFRSNKFRNQFSQNLWQLLKTFCQV